ncbi:MULTISPECIES: hemolysin III family protein [Rhodomicrobium]|uniref:PAQR family membrane homeostasis protein TrhA n=1 Tax=Rhodomicrobium TaxID=1068 RepID=UPI000B4A760E|nr:MULTISPECIES: hemolysin III family protein [Rhodomicrobium]
MFPAYSRRERAADAVVHVAGIAFGIAGTAALMLAALGQLSTRDVTGLLIYSAGMIVMFSASAAYHMVDRPRLKGWLRRADHAAIFVMIAGSYTPFALSKIGGQTGLLLLLVVWTVAVLGVAVKLLFPRRLDKISVALYLAQGWMIVFAMGPLLEALPDTSFLLLVIGGGIYSAGVIFHLMERMPFHNVVWHVFVLCGAIVQYASIYGAVIP